jgi:hypothetical protein
MSARRAGGAVALALGYAILLSALYLWFRYPGTAGAVIYGLIAGLFGAALVFGGAVLVLTDRR